MPKGRLSECRLLDAAGEGNVFRNGARNHWELPNTDDPIAYQMAASIYFLTTTSDSNDLHNQVSLATSLHCVL